MLNRCASHRRIHNERRLLMRWKHLLNWINARNPPFSIWNFHRSPQIIILSSCDLKSIRKTDFSIMTNVSCMMWIARNVLLLRKGRLRSLTHDYSREWIMEAAMLLLSNISSTLWVVQSLWDKWLLLVFNSTWIEICLIWSASSNLPNWLLLFYSYSTEVLIWLSLACTSCSSSISRFEKGQTLWVMRNMIVCVFVNLNSSQC